MDQGVGFGSGAGAHGLEMMEFSGFGVWEENELFERVWRKRGVKNNHGMGC